LPRASSAGHVVGAVLVLGVMVSVAADGEVADRVPGVVGRPVDGVAAMIHSATPIADLFPGQFCGGVLIADDSILTAAHCVAMKDPTGIDVVVGADNLCRGGPIAGERIRVIAVNLHPKYDPVTGEFDIAVLQLAHAAAGRIHPVGTPPSAASQATAVGWGTSGQAGQIPCRLRSVQLALLSAPECHRELDTHPGRAFDPSSMLCALPLNEYGDDTCAGDSGGPLLIGRSLDRAVAVGVVSWGYGCGRGVPGVYARADQMQSWSNIGS